MKVDTEDKKHAPKACSGRQKRVLSACQKQEKMVLLVVEKDILYKAKQ